MSKSKNIRPLVVAQRFLKWYCRDGLLEQIEGDLNEEFNERVKRQGPIRARLMYLFAVLRFCQPFTWKKGKGPGLNNKDLFFNYFKIGYRNLVKYKTFSLLNTVGLALSMSLCLLIILFVKEKKAMDNFHSNKESIYRIITHEELKNRHLAYTPPNVATQVASEYAGIQQSVQMFRTGDIVSLDKKELWFTGLFADESFFEVFSFELTSGQEESALKEMSSIVISAAMAKEFFGNESPLGKTLVLSRRGEFTVTAVVESDRQSHISFDYLVPFSNISQEFIDGWKSALDFGSGFYYSYLLLDPAANPEQLTDPLVGIATDFNQKNDEEHLSFSLQALTDIPLGDGLDYEMTEFPPRFAVYFLSLLSIAVIAIACFNYVSLSTARSVKRAKEIGLRKISGASRRSVVFQFLAESVMLAVFSLVLSIIVLYYLIPAFNGLEIIREINATVSLDIAGDYRIYLLFLAFSIVVGISAGIYPALYLSSLKPIAIVGSGGTQPASRGRLRKVLLTIQLAFSLIFIIVTTAQFRQYKYLLSFEYGFQKENIINLDLQGIDYARLKSELLKDRGVISVSAVSSLPGLAGTGFRNELWLDSTKIQAFRFVSDEGLFETLDLELAAGNNFSSQSTRQDIILNEGAAAALGATNPNQILNSILRLGETEVVVKGVVKNFHHGRVDRVLPESPLVISYNPDQVRFANVRITGDDVASTLGRLETLWSALNSNFDFDYSFYDTSLERRFVAFKDIIKIFTVAASAAIFIACMGLLGMAAYNADLRVKEIGIRKVMGASIFSLFNLLNRDYLKLLAIAAVFALPLAWIITSALLDNFASKINVGVGLLALGVLMILIPTIVVISTQTLRAAFANPTDSLREE